MTYLSPKHIPSSSVAIAHASPPHRQDTGHSLRHAIRRASAPRISPPHACMLAGALDSSVRIASLLFRPLVDALFHEKDRRAQISPALSLAAAAAFDPDSSLLPRLLKLLNAPAIQVASIVFMICTNH